jgi:hypothetical protein
MIPLKGTRGTPQLVAGYLTRLVGSLPWVPRTPAADRLRPAPLRFSQFGAGLSKQASWMQGMDRFSKLLRRLSEAEQAGNLAAKEARNQLARVDDLLRRIEALRQHLDLNSKKGRASNA